MNKYIDAEKLIERLEEMKRAEYENCGGVNSKTGVLQEVQELISSLQDVLPESSNNLVDTYAVREDFITEVYRVLDADPTNDRANAIIDAFDSLPTVSQVQPEVGLEKETHYIKFEKDGNQFKFWFDIELPDELTDRIKQTIMTVYHK